MGSLNGALGLSESPAAVYLAISFLVSYVATDGGANEMQSFWFGEYKQSVSESVADIAKRDCK